MTNPIFEDMKSRVTDGLNANVSKATDDDVSSLQKRIWDINEWLCDLGTPVLDKKVLVEEVAFGSSANWDEDEVDNGRPFHFHVIQSKEEATELAIVMSGAAGLDEKWPVKSWIAKAFDRTSNDRFVISVRRDGDLEAAGFIVLESEFYFDSDDLDDLGNKEEPTFENADKKIQFSLGVESVYVSPAKRGLGFGSALRWATTSHVFYVLDRLSDLSPDRIEEMGTPPIDFFFHGDAYSARGAMVGRSIREMAQVQCDIFVDDPDKWITRIDFCDGFDDVDFPYDVEFPDGSVLRPGR